MCEYEYWFLIKLLVTVVVAIFGWFVAHWLSSMRDEKSKKREIVTGYLISAFSEIERSIEPNEIAKEWFVNLGAALHKIQLFGDERQIELVHKIFEVMQNKNATFPNDKLMELLRILRNDLRKELKLKPVNSGVILLRLEKKGIPNK